MAVTERDSASKAGRAADQVFAELDALCASLGPGGRVPPHTELMRRFDASERAVREALDTLHRTGRITRRRGAGTFVAATGAASADDLRAEHDRTAALPGALATARTVVAIAPTDHSFFERSLDLLCRRAEAADLSLICKPLTTLDERALADLGHTLLASRASGFIVFSFPLEPLARQLQAGGARVVFFGTPPVDVVSAPFPWVCGDQEYGGYLATNHLIELGHRRLAFVYYDEGLQRNRRWRGHQRAIEEARRQGLDIEERVLGKEILIWKTDPAQAAAFFQSPGAPTGLVCWNDHVATNLIPVLHRAGVPVPGKVSVIGYDDLPEGKLVYPPLTTVDPATSQQIRLAVDLLTRQGPVPATQTLFAPTLVSRESTAPSLPADGTVRRSD